MSTWVCRFVFGAIRVLNCVSNQEKIEAPHARGRLRLVIPLLARDPAMHAVATPPRAPDALAQARRLSIPSDVPPPYPRRLDVPDEWRRFGDQYGLTEDDLRSLLVHSPWVITPERVTGVAAHLHKALAQGDWTTCESCLSVLLRNDLRDVFDTVCECGLGWLAVVAAEQDASAKGPAGSTARLGRVLAAQLDGLLEEAVLVRSYAKGQ